MSVTSSLNGGPWWHPSRGIIGFWIRLEILDVAPLVPTRCGFSHKQWALCDGILVGYLGGLLLHRTLLLTPSAAVGSVAYVVVFLFS